MTITALRVRASYLLGRGGENPQPRIIVEKES